MEKELLRIENIHKSFDGQEVLKGVSLSAAEGEFITILGPSGCGKTTTLRIIAGLEEADAGIVRIAGEDVTDRPPNERQVNTVFQSYALFPHMDVAGNIGYGLRIRRTPKEEIRRRVQEALTLVALEGYEKRRISQLSGGQKQRVAIARAIVNEPRLLLLDEPLGALDLKLRRQMQVELKALQKKLGMTFVYITHDQEEARYLSDRILVMNAGVIEQDAPAEEVFTSPATAFVADFIRDPMRG